MHLHVASCHSLSYDLVNLLVVSSPSILDGVSIMLGVLCVLVISITSMICVTVPFSCAASIYY